MHIFLNIWAIFGPLIGILIGSWLTTRNQRKQWIMDNKRDEYRELLTTIADTGSNLLVLYGAKPGFTIGPGTQMTGEVLRKSVDTIYNRLFVSGQIARLDILTRWKNAISALQDTRDVNAFGESMDGIMNDIRKAAVEDFS